MTPNTLYAGTQQSVFDIEQTAAVPCVGDCNSDQAVTFDKVVALVNIALGTV